MKRGICRKHVLFAFAVCIASALSVQAEDIFSRSFFSSFKQLDRQRWYVSDGWSNGDWQSCEWRASQLSIVKGKLQMQLSDQDAEKRPYSCSELHANARTGYGLYEARMKVAAGSGLNTAFFTYIGPPMHVPEWDEIDFEFLGKDPKSVQVNFYTNGKGQHETIVPLGFDASKDFHNYAFDWQPNKIRWYVDGRLVHESTDGVPIPRNPGFLFLSLWSAGKGETNWLGTFNYSGPVRAEVAWAGYTASGKKCLFPQSMTCKK